VPTGTARAKSYRFPAAQVGYSCSLALLIMLFASRGLQTAVADGDTRTISMHHVHTDESITITYKRDGRYDEAALEKLNWLLRDWRQGKSTRMDPQLIDLLWEVQRETGSKVAIDIVCGYRAPETNAMLRRRSRGVARFSQHMLGHAIDFYIPGVPLEQLREIGLRLQRGGVGFYPTSGSPFVHMDTGGVRMWPRMTRNELMHVFPDGRTVYLPTDGHPLPGYALAMADLRGRGQNPTATWSEEARDEGLDDSIVLATETTRTPAAPARSPAHIAAPAPLRVAQAAPAPQVAQAAPAPAAAPSHTSGYSLASAPATVAPMNSLFAALQLEAARKRQQAAIAAAPPAPSTSTGGAVYQTASYITPADAPAPSLQPAVDTSADASDTRATARKGDEQRTLQLASADMTGAMTPWPGAFADRVPPQLALAYARSTGQEPPSATAATRAAPVHVAQAAQLPRPQADTTIAVKRIDDQPTSAIVAARPKGETDQLEGLRFDNPWLDAVLVSPDLRHFMTALMLGAENYGALSQLVEKPAQSVVMTFGPEPNPGLTTDHFSGPAVGVISTVTYKQAQSQAQSRTHTALR
jgi:uncharacterized protein YcbK (DUF882 family)